MRRLIGVVAAGMLMALATPAIAKDSLAPPHAAPNWLPKSEWVTRHWAPFDEALLNAELGLAEGDLEAYLYNDHRPLTDLVTARGVQLEALLARLTAWTAALPARSVRVVRDHARRVMTQPHLAQHVFFHVFHGMRVAPHARAAFGMDPARYRRLRKTGYSARWIARLGGVSPRRARSVLRRQLAADRDAGIRSRLMPAAEARRMYARRVARLSCWLVRPSPWRDPTNPYGHQPAAHDHFYGHIPATPAARRENDALVQRYRRNIRKGCWPIPKAWDWAARGLVAP